MKQTGNGTVRVKAREVASLGLLKNLECLDIWVSKFAATVELLPAWDSRDQERFFTSFPRLERLSLGSTCEISQSAFLALTRSAPGLKYCYVRVYIDLGRLDTRGAPLFPALEHLHVKGLPILSARKNNRDKTPLTLLHHHMPKLQALFREQRDSGDFNLSDAFSQARGEDWIPCKWPTWNSDFSKDLEGIAHVDQTFRKNKKHRRPRDTCHPLAYLGPIYLSRAHYLSQSDYIQTTRKHNALSF
ncbi:hypothetical protein ANO11243_092370 [Dothideomycetidae sp. 11243]|nr:hypothetical protein ANO11243_092370 [fungal sp. No.11243]